MKASTVILSILFFLFTMQNISYANSGLEKAGIDIHSIIEADYKLRYADSLEKQKNEFGVNSNANFQEATIGEGIIYYKINLNKDTLSHEIVGYKFPLYLKGDQVAVIDTRLISGSWKIFDISNLNNFDSTIKKLESDFANYGELELIEDVRYKLNLLYFKKTDHYINLKNNKPISSNAVKDIVSDLSDSKYLDSNTENTAKLVGSDYDNNTSGHKTSIIIPIVLFGLSLLFAIPLLITIINKRKSLKK